MSSNVQAQLNLTGFTYQGLLKYYLKNVECEKQIPIHLASVPFQNSKLLKGIRNSILHNYPLKQFKIHIRLSTF